MLTLKYRRNTFLTTTFKGTCFFKRYVVTQTALLGRAGYLFLRVLPEFSAVQELYNLGNVTNVHANHDTLRLEPKSYPGQQQASPDFSTTVKTIWNNLNFSGHKRDNRLLHQDEKKGLNMFQHSTSGSLGICYFDVNGQCVQTMAQPVSQKKLVEYGIERINAIRQAAKTDGIHNASVEKLLQNAQDLLYTKSLSPLEAYNQSQQYLWDNIQRNINYNRNLSLVFTKTLEEYVETPQFKAFSSLFKSKLNENKFYDLDRRGDNREIMLALLSSYSQTIDLKIFDKIRDIQNQGITFNTKFMQDMNSLIKKYVFTV